MTKNNFASTSWHVWFFLFLECFLLSCPLKSSAQIASANKTTSYEGIPLYYWQQKSFVNFGDYLSLVLVERIVGVPVKTHQNYPQFAGVKKMLAIGSIMSFAKNFDVIWGTGVNGKLLEKKRLSIRLFRCQSCSRSID